jgi:hypothetical protein
MSEKQADEFDTISGVGGKHLAPKRPLDYAVSFITLTAISAIVAAGGLLGLRIWDATLIFDDQVTSEDSLDTRVPQVEVAIVDGTNSGLAEQLGDDLSAAGWNILKAVELVELPETDPGVPAPPTTLIFISDESHRTAAARLARLFPQAPIQLSEQFRDPITVLIGLDFQK